MPSCCYCTQKASDSVCLACRTKFEALEREVTHLKRQNAFLRAQGALQYHARKAEIRRKAAAPPRPRAK
jgi:hypothetical protein